MQGLFGIVHKTSLGSIDVDDVRRALASLQAPAAFEEILWTDPDRRVVLGRLGLPTLAPRPSLPGTASTAADPEDSSRSTCLLDGEYLVRSGPQASDEYQRDPEQLLQLYRQHRDDLGAQLQGWFSIAIVDAARGQLHVWNDRFGHRPLHYHHDGERLLLASTTRLATRLGNLRAHVDFEALAQFLRYQHCISDNSLFEELRVLPPATHLVFDLESGELSLRPYWHLNDIELEREMTYADAVDEGTRLFRQAVRRATSGSHRFGLFLSGGLDSRMILGALGEQARGLPVINYGVPRGGDVVYARQVARAAGAAYHHIEPAHAQSTRDFCDFFFRYSFTPLHYFNGGNITVNRHAARYFDVHLSGLCGESLLGDLFATAPYTLPTIDAESTFDSIDSTLGSGRFNPESIGHELALSLFTTDFAERLGDRARQSLRGVVDGFDCVWERRIELVYMATRAQRCLTGLLQLERSGFESRPVYYDYDLVEFFLGAPHRYRIDRRLNIAVLNRVTPRLSRVPATGTCVPPLEDRRRVRWFDKRNRAQTLLHRYLPFVPPLPNKELSAWPEVTRSDTVHWAEDYLLSDESKLRSVLRQDYVRSLIRRIPHDKDRSAWVLGHLVTLEGSLRLG